MKFNIAILIVLFQVTGAVTDTASGQAVSSAQDINLNDSLSFQDVIQVVLTTHPTVLEAREAINEAQARIGLARAAYYPNIEVDMSYARLGPVPELTIPELGTFQFVPENNYNGSLNVSQTIYDFSKTAHNVRLEESNKALSESNVPLVQQKLTLTTATAYYTLVYLQQALQVEETQLKTLEEHLDFVTTKKETGSATKYEILSTQVRISQAENQKVDIETSIKTMRSILNSLMGLPVDTEIKVGGSFLLTQPSFEADSLISYALEHRSEVVLARLREKHAELHLQSVKTQNNPVLSAFVAGGWKNGYIPDINKLTANFSAGVELRVPIFDATRHRNNLRMVSSEITVSRQESDRIAREIATEVYQNEAGLQASQRKIEQSEMQVRQAAEALQLAQVNYSIGAITNLDLLDSQTALAESRIMLLKARVDHAISIVRLDISLGRIIG